MTDNAPPQSSPEATSSSAATRRRSFARRVASPIIAVLALLYFLIDALFLSFIRPIAEKLAAWNIFYRMGAWIRSLGPYQTLALFLVPLIILEPVKPVAAYLFASGHFTNGFIVLVVGETLKITIVERLFHIGKDKLLTIPAFAWAYHLVVQWIEYLKSFSAWQAVMRQVHAIKLTARRLTSIVKAWASAWRQRLRNWWIEE
ncbi:MAG TPA: hypothetical protein VHN11_04675 [Xanthobacteraceae bacterium]|jgi:hypothetical protein|nr:hypothetical protein [Xanthobacteraceae bacterium]